MNQVTAHFEFWRCKIGEVPTLQHQTGDILTVVFVLCCRTTGLSPHLAVPAQRQVLGVVDDLVVFVFALALAELLLLLFLALLPGPGLLPLDVLVGQLPLLL